MEQEHYTDTLFYQIELTAKYCKLLGQQVFEKYNTGITVEEFAVLDTVMCNGELCQRDVAKLILKDRPSTGRLLNSLEEKGLIKRFADTKNNRLVRKTKLTAKGQKNLEQITAILKEYFAKMPKVISSDRIQELKQRIREFRDIIEKEVEMKI